LQYFGLEWKIIWILYNISSIISDEEEPKSIENDRFVFLSWPIGLRKARMLDEVDHKIQDAAK
jgi:hypothetical protein